MKLKQTLMPAAALLILSACGTIVTPSYEPVNKALLSRPSGPTSASEWPELSDWSGGKQAPQDAAVIVAVEDYAFLPDVPGAVRNATDWERYFRQERGMSKVYMLTDRQATREEIARFAEQASSEVGAGGKLWFVFIGHGASLTDGSDGALVGMDAQQTVASIEARSLKRGELAKTLEKGGQAETVMVLDTCFSGRAPTGELLAAGTQPVVPVESAPSAGKSTVILAAAANTEVAGELPAAGRPAFTYLLLGALRGWADDGDGVVSAEEAIQFTREQLRHLKGRQQTPGLDGNGAVALGKSLGESDPGLEPLMGGAAVAPPPEALDLPAGTLLDSKQGLYFVKPEGFAFGPIGGGLIIQMTSLHGGSELQILKQQMPEANAASWFKMAHESLESELEVIRAPQKVDYGPVVGWEAEYRRTGQGSEDPAMGGYDAFALPLGAEVFVWETYYRGAGWRVVMTIPDSKNEQLHYDVFRSFVTDMRYP